MPSKTKPHLAACLAIFVYPFAALADPPDPSRQASTEVSPQAWQKTITEAAPAGKGCFQVAYPSTAPKQVPCEPAPAAPKASPPKTFGKIEQKDVGGGHSYILLTPKGKTISRITGSFPSINGVKSVSSIASSQTGPNSYSLQINAGASDHTSICDGLGEECDIWQQFVYSTTADDGNNAVMFIGYWLLNVESCPSPFKREYGYCIYGSPRMTVPSIPATDLDKAQLWGFSYPGVGDRLYLVYKDRTYMLNTDASPLRLGEAWDSAEFNIFGYDAGGKAFFNPGSTVDVRIAAALGVENYQVLPQCVEGGRTAEKNNLQLVNGSCTSWIYPNPAGVGSPYIQFTQKSNDEIPPFPALSFQSFSNEEIDKIQWTMQVQKKSTDKSRVWWWDMHNDVHSKGKVGFTMQPAGPAGYGSTDTVAFYLSGDEGLFKDVSINSPSCTQEGGNVSCSVSYPWVLGRFYSFTLETTAHGGSGRTWTGTVTDNTTGIVTPIGSVSVPTSWWPMHSTRTVAAIPQPIQLQSQACSALPYTDVIIKDPLVYSKGASPLPTLLSDISGGCVTYTPLTGQYGIQIGGTETP